MVQAVERFLKVHSDDSFGTAKKQNRQDTEELKEC
jgi:hypothetical protein